MSDSTPRLALPELAADDAQNHLVHNEALIQLDAFVDLYLLGQFVNAPPSSPADGDAYLVGGSPTGAWSGYAYKIAYCIDGAWRFYTPFNGLRAYVATTGAFIVYVGGTWTDWNSLISAGEVSVASATTCDLGAAGSLFVQITGTAAIASFGTGANKLRFVRFAGALTLTHNAASLILLGGLSRTTAAGDVGIYASDASGNWRERQYVRAACDPGDYATKSGTQTLTNKTLGATSLPGGGSITSDGKLGVMTAPSYKFHVADGTAANSLPQLMVEQTNNSSRAGFYVTNSGDGGFANNLIGVAVHGSAYASDNYLSDGTADHGLALVWAQDNGGATLQELAVGTFSNVPMSLFTNNTRRLYITNGGVVRPGSDNAQTLGDAAHRWSVVYAGTGTINTSGAETKTNVRALSDAEIAVAKALAATVRVFQFCGAVAKKGVDAARLHVGTIYEDVTAAFAAHGLDAERYGIVCRDRDDADPQKWILGLRYGELAQFVTAGFAARLAALEAR